MPGPLALDREAIGELCRRYGVRRLTVFGSAVTDHFDRARSDVDFLAEFSDDLSNKFDAYFGLKEELEELLGRRRHRRSRRALRRNWRRPAAWRSRPGHSAGRRR